MPNLDGTGPLGKGALTGRKKGICEGGGAENNKGPGFGQGKGREQEQGRRQGRGRGQGNN